MFFHQQIAFLFSVLLILVGGYFTYTIFFKLLFIFFSLDHIYVYVFSCSYKHDLCNSSASWFFFFLFSAREVALFLCVCRLGMKLLNTNMIYYLAYYMLPYATNNNILYNQFFLWWRTEILNWLVFSVSHHKHHVWMGWSSGSYSLWNSVLYISLWWFCQLWCRLQGMAACLFNDKASIIS